jgi:hypothetical protein
MTGELILEDMFKKTVANERFTTDRGMTILHSLKIHANIFKKCLL